MKINSKRGVFFIVLLTVLAVLLSGCNIYDWTHKDDDIDTLDKALDNARAALNDNDYSGAVTLYQRIIDKYPTSSEARVGYSSAILLRDVELADLPKLMNAIFNIQTASSSNDFLQDLSGRNGMTGEAYVQQVMDACSNAAYARSAVIGIDPDTGYMMLSNNKPVVDPAVSDGVIPSDDRNTILNYVIHKAVHVALYVKQNFDVSADMVASIDVASLSNEAISDAAYSNQLEFARGHYTLTNTATNLMVQYMQVTNLILTTNKNTSVDNLFNVADNLITFVSNSGFDTGTVDEARARLTDLNDALNDFQASLDWTNFQAEFNSLNSLISDIEDYGTNQSTIILGSNLMPYNNLDPADYTN